MINKYIILIGLLFLNGCMSIVEHDRILKETTDTYELREQAFNEVINNIEFKLSTCEEKIKVELIP